MDIAILDSGINPWHSHVQGIKGGLGFHPLPEDTKITVSTDCCDNLGHGTAIAGIIRRGAPKADLFAFKIFHEALHCSAAVLLGALSWAINANMKMIHLSLGTVNAQYKSELTDLARQANDKNIILVAAARNDMDVIYPAVFKTVMGVYWNKSCPEDKVVFNPEKTVEFGAYGRPICLSGQRPEDNFSGSSFAAARVSAMAARILCENPRAGPEEVKDKIVALFGL